MRLVVILSSYDVELSSTLRCIKTVCKRRGANNGVDGSVTRVPELMSSFLHFQLSYRERASTLSVATNKVPHPQPPL